METPSISNRDKMSLPFILNPIHCTGSNGRLCVLLETDLITDWDDGRGNEVESKYINPRGNRNHFQNKHRPDTKIRSREFRDWVPFPVWSNCVVSKNIEVKDEISLNTLEHQRCLVFGSPPTSLFKVHPFFTNTPPRPRSRRETFDQGISHSYTRTLYFIL